MTQSEQINELAAAMAKAQSEIQGASKDTANPFFSSRYADLASVWEACRAALTKNGVSVIQSPSTLNHSIVVTTILTHASGQWIKGELSLSPGYTNKQGEFVSLHDAQAAGSAITYARRYALAAMVGVAPEDDDGNGAMGRKNGQANDLEADPKSKGLPGAPSQPSDPKDWRSAISHIGTKAKNKALGTLDKETVKNLTEHLRSNAKTAQDKKLLVFCEMAMAEICQKAADDIPMDHGEQSASAKHFLSLLQYEGEYTAEQFMEVARSSGWVSCEKFSELSEEKIAELIENLDSVVVPALKLKFKKEAK